VTFKDEMTAAAEVLIGSKDFKTVLEILKKVAAKGKTPID